MKYVRFVSKRGTVAVFAAPEGDRTHTYVIKVGTMQSAWQAKLSEIEQVKFLQ
jgi:hypothetical protein